MTQEDFMSLKMGDVITNGKETVRVLSVGEDYVCVDVSWQEQVVRDHVYDISANMWEMANNAPIKKGQPGYKAYREREEEMRRW